MCIRTQEQRERVRGVATELLSNISRVKRRYVDVEYAADRRALAPRSTFITIIRSRTILRQKSCGVDWHIKPFDRSTPSSTTVPRGQRRQPGRFKAFVHALEVPVADINLTQEDADALLAMEKHKADDTTYEYPSLGGGIRVPLLSPDKRESSFSTSPGARSSSQKGRIRIGPGAWRFWLGSISAVRLIEIRTTKRSRALTCISTAKATAIDGRCRCPPSGFRRLAIPGCCC